MGSRVISFNTTRLLFLLLQVQLAPIGSCSVPLTRNGRSSFLTWVTMGPEQQIHRFGWGTLPPPYADVPVRGDVDRLRDWQWLLWIIEEQHCAISRRSNQLAIPHTPRENRVNLLEQINQGGFRHLQSVDCTVGLPLDIVQSRRQRFIRTGQIRIIEPEVDSTRTVETCSTQISIY